MKMRLLSGSEIFDDHFKASTVTIGNFDGVHRGHQEIFRCLMQAGSERCLPTVVVTFEPHPLKILAPSTAPPQLTTFDQKVSLIADAGIDCLVAVPFSVEFSKMTAENFVRDFLCRSLGMKHVVIGHDYAFGRGREGNFDTLERMGSQSGFTLEDMPPIGNDGIVFSSSLARNMIADGNLKSVATILGRYYSILGMVEHGRKIGQTIGFPTANIHTPNELIPPDGVYAVLVDVGGVHMKGACTIGCNPTFDGTTRTIEVFLLDFSDQIYDQTIMMHFVQKLRSIRRFPDIAELKNAISQDVATARSVLETLDTNYLRHSNSLELCADYI